MELYRKVIIKSEDDLPKHEFFIDKHLYYHIKDVNDLGHYRGYSSSWDDYFLANVDWYLLPIEQEPPKEVKSAEDFLFSKYPFVSKEWFKDNELHQEQIKLMEEYASQFTTQRQVTAKSGRKYRSIPDDVDIETWDNMTVAERLHYKGLIVERQATDEEIYELIKDVREQKLNGKGKGLMGIGRITLGEIEWMDLCLYVAKAIRDGKK